MGNRQAELAVRVDGLSKTYRVFASPKERVRRVLGLHARFLDFDALADVSLGISKGEAVGIVGENGAGKSTLLKIISGTTAPTSGTVEVTGKVASILELGAGFHQDFSGRDNAILYGALMGFDGKAMAQRLEQIIEFAELGEFIDHPIKVYSTGMTMRLGFAVATHVNPDVLIIDEALAVGDGYFQKKCVDRLLQIKDEGTTILFCSHSMYYVTMFCDRAVWLDHGRVRRHGTAKEVVEEYETFLLERGMRRLDGPGEVDSGPGSQLKVGRIARVLMGEHETGEDGVVLDPGDPLTVTVLVESLRTSESFQVGVALITVDGRCVFAASSKWDGMAHLEGQSHYTVRLEIPALPVAAGTFNLSVYLLDETGLHVHDQVVLPHCIRVASRQWTPSLLELEHHWSVT
ncbi:MAG: ABC transporter ATP-binding protein [Acidobacteria bacterium]|nr:ABC transporter ATP-binding protein [Acidobacteriota bacterium]